jgi:adenylosuccinate synthase
LHGADYLSYEDLGARDWDDLSGATRDFVDKVETKLGVPVDYVFTGPDGADLVARKAAADRGLTPRSGASLLG